MATIAEALTFARKASVENAANPPEQWPAPIRLPDAVPVMCETVSREQRPPPADILGPLNAARDAFRRTWRANHWRVRAREKAIRAALAAFARAQELETP